jgi:thiamine-phosphate pyrophosphorylase
MPVDFKLYLITDRKQTKLTLPDAVRLALQGGVKAIQVREKDLPTRDLLELARELREITKKFGAKLFVNDRVDVALSADADGVHLGHQSMHPEAVRKIIGSDMLIGVSTHTIAEAKTAESAGADFLTFGPVFHTLSKAHFGAAVGLEYLKSAKKTIKIPVFGLGGINSGNARQVLKFGADGVSLISAIFAADDVQKAAESIIKEIH